MTSLYKILLSDEMESADERRKLARKILRGDMSATVAITPPAPVEEGSARALMRFYLSDASTTRTVQAISVPKYRTAIELLEAGAGHSDVLLKAVTVDFAFTTGAKPKPISQQLHQEKEIMRAINDLGYSANTLPKSARGKKGPKSEVREKIGKAMTVGVFDKAWERLRSQKEIQEEA